MTKQTQTLGQLELEVLKIIWANPGCTVPQAAETLIEKKEYARTTILTVIQRLHKKGFLHRRKTDGVYRYYPTENKAAVLGNLAKQFVQNIFEGSSAGLVQHLTNSDITPAELARMREIIDNALEAGEINND